jgi:small subunit ribosomal protein S6
VAERIREYEACAIYKGDSETEKLDEYVEAIRSLISNRGGEIVRIDRWNKRYLAYPIKRYTDGYYVVYRWHGSPELLPDFNYAMRYNDAVLRYLVLDYTEKERKRRKRMGHGKAKTA